LKLNLCTGITHGSLLLLVALALAVGHLSAQETAGPAAASGMEPGSMDVRWDEGAVDCSRSTQPPLQVHAYNATSFVLRENLCATFEGPFLYLLIGSSRALLIDTGDVADPGRMPLAATVLGLLPQTSAGRLPLLVAHSHRHLDHRAGDAQFAGLRDVELVGFDIDSVKRFYQLRDWPMGFAQIDLGSRSVDVIPTPGHNETEATFYDRNTGLLLSGDFVLPGRLLIDDAYADLASAERIAAFAAEHRISHVLGGHIELDRQGRLFTWESHYHPGEHALELPSETLQRLPEAISRFNGLYTAADGFVMIDSMHVLIACGILVLVVLSGIAWVATKLLRRRRRATPG
jgi:hydroxyacylglutathione hydrolase